MNQKKMFLKSEGDCYYKRNKDHYLTSKNTYIISELYEFYSSYIKPGEKILEIGCCNGINLNYYFEENRCQAYGIDPSRAAIESGKELFPELNLTVGTADNLLYDDQFFDMVIFGSSLHWVDRSLLSKVVAEADRVLKDKGFLGISDFDAKIPRKIAYKHMEGIFTYKCDYASLFTSFPHFSLVEKKSKKMNDELPFSEDLNERFSSSVIYKNYEQGYI